MFAKHPLQEEDRLVGLDIPISFFYGDLDWMMKEGGEYVVSKNKFNGTQSHVYFVESSGHHMYFDNPEEFANLIIEDIFFTEERLHLIEGRPEYLQT